jgi:hypothetical protein
MFEGRFIEKAAMQPSSPDDGAPKRIGMVVDMLLIIC